MAKAVNSIDSFEKVVRQSESLGNNPKEIDQPAFGSQQRFWCLWVRHCQERAYPVKSKNKSPPMVCGSGYKEAQEISPNLLASYIIDEQISLPGRV